MSLRYDALVLGAGQAGLATAYHLQQRGLHFQVLEASHRPVGSWPLHYKSLKLFSPARHAALPGLPFPGDPERYPSRDEVVAYLNAYAAHFQFPVVTAAEATQVLPDDEGFRVMTADGQTFFSRTVIAATGTYRRPFIPTVPSQELFRGTILHSLAYQEPSPFSGQRVLVVGAGNSAVQIAVELAQVARVSLAARTPVQFTPQRILGRDIHDWVTWLRVDQLTLGHIRRLPCPRNVFDHGVYRAAFRQGRLDQRAMFLQFTVQGVVWPGRQEEAVDTVVYATGYRANLDFLRGTGALDRRGEPIQRLGVSRTVPGLYFVGLSGQRALASATLRGAGQDAALVVGQMTKRSNAREQQFSH